MDSADSKETPKKEEEFRPEVYMPKKWLNAPGQGFGEKCDMCMFKCIYLFPVIVTFLLFAFLVSFYAYVSQTASYDYKRIQ